jgi:hypothetical protein
LKNVFRLLLFVSIIFAACASDGNKTEVKNMPHEVNSDSTAIAETIHAFYKWYAETGDQLSQKFKFIQTNGQHANIDEAMLAQYFAEFAKTGLVSAALVADETRFYQACAALWKNEAAGGRLPGLDIDRYYCQNDPEISEFLTAGVNFRIRGDIAKVRLMLKELGPNHGAREYEMKKENGKWLLAKLRCNSGVKY